MLNSANGRGIIAMMTAVVLFVTSDTLMKLVSTDHPAGQIVAIRGLFACLFVMAFVLARQERHQLALALSPRVLARAVVESGAALFYISGLAYLKLANIIIIMQSTPIIMTVIAVIFGLEQVGWRRWAAILVGFFGVLLVVQPSSENFNIYALLALGSALCVSARDLINRSIGAHVPSLIITLSTTVCVTLAGFGLGVSESWPPLSTHHLILLIGAALLVTCGNLMVIIAFRGTDVSVVAPFRYTIVVSAIASGFLVFGEWPDPLAWCGIGFIILSGLYMLHRESRKI
jgi:drug/metabolite transporter (DMT)-like permease